MSFTPGPQSEEEKRRLQPLGGWRWRLTRVLHYPRFVAQKVRSRWVELRDIRWR
ncbi:hypothetical protein H6F75_00580 [Nodosilinea sp. FACHB-131]|uniref:hypothetical protein n=1 Tax=Cyanophyceae TaxID=3028117 RepID=UPI001687663B|nr:hypothetical protein [Nodosilinea sp. FACHB-131]MBD1871966.1 hypothetical protein [Nodosilinea sp. FACHB-131]